MPIRWHKYQSDEKDKKPNEEGTQKDQRLTSTLTRSGTGMGLETGLVKLNGTTTEMNFKPIKITDLGKLFSQ